MLMSRSFSPLGGPSGGRRPPFPPSLSWAIVMPMEPAINPRMDWWCFSCLCRIIGPSKSLAMWFMLPRREWREPGGCNHLLPLLRLLPAVLPRYEILCCGPWRTPLDPFVWEVWSWPLFRPCENLCTCCVKMAIPCWPAVRNVCSHALKAWPNTLTSGPLSLWAFMAFPLWKRDKMSLDCSSPEAGPPLLPMTSVIEPSCWHPFWWDWSMGWWDSCWVYWLEWGRVCL